jgi:hypothetical protein
LKAKGRDYLPIGQPWRRNWSRLIHFFDYPPEMRKVIYTTNAIESVQRAAGIAAIVIVGRNRFPSLMTLTLDERFTGLPLRMQRIEILFESLVG